MERRSASDGRAARPTRPELVGVFWLVAMLGGALLGGVLVEEGQVEGVLVEGSLVEGGGSVAAWAHPGRTDGSGCHTCRSNCSRWGLRSGERHCGHGRRGSSSPSPRPRAPESRPVAPLVVEQAPESDSGASNWIARDPDVASKVGEKLTSRLSEKLDASAISTVVKVLSVVDGDTLVARSGEKLYLLRLRGVDAPELEQPFGINARDWLSRQLAGRRITVEPSKGEGCLVPVEIRAQDGTSLAETQLKLGFAWVTSEAPEAWRRIEARARGVEVGLWSGQSPEAPWIWRARKMGGRVKWDE